MAKVRDWYGTMTLGEHAYHAYVEALKHGPAWGHLPRKQREAWESAAEEVQRALEWGDAPALPKGEDKP